MAYGHKLDIWGPQGLLVRGAAVTNCTAAFLVGGAVVNCTAAFLVAGKERMGKVQKRSLDPKYTIQVGFTGDSIIWTRQKIDISNTYLVGIADTTGLGCWDSESQYILL